MAEPAIINLGDTGADPAGNPAAGYVYVYVKSGTTYTKNSSGTVTTMGGITSLTGGVTATGPGASAATVVTNANLTGAVTSSGNATTLVDSITGHIQTAANATYVLDQSAAYGYTINTLIIQTSSGTCTAKLQIGGVDVTSISAVSVSSAPATATATAANVVSAAGRVTLVITSNASALDVSFTVKYTRTT